MNESKRQIETAAHATRVCANTAISCSSEANTLEQLTRTVFYLSLWNSVQHSLQAQQFGASHQWVNCGILQRNTNATAHFVRVLCNIETRDGSGARSWAKQCGEHANSSGFPCTVWPEKSKNLASFYCDVDAINSLDIAEISDKVLGNNWVSGRTSKSVHAPTLRLEIHAVVTGVV